MDVEFIIVIAAFGTLFVCCLTCVFAYLQSRSLDRLNSTIEDLAWVSMAAELIKSNKIERYTLAFMIDFREYIMEGSHSSEEIKEWGAEMAQKYGLPGRINV